MSNVVPGPFGVGSAKKLQRWQLEGANGAQMMREQSGHSQRLGGTKGFISDAISSSVSPDPRSRMEGTRYGWKDVRGGRRGWAKTALLKRSEENGEPCGVPRGYNYERKQEVS